MIKDYIGDKVILRNGLVCRFFDYNELENVLIAVKKERETKLNRYGLEKYKKYMDTWNLETANNTSTSIALYGGGQHTKVLLNLLTIWKQEFI